ncbi:hypothetical protein BN7_5330 [Wickerhamomyces ciferrii]|uniref:Protein HID1 n=1 Tax=Wickerhamomyces ciferrii (strain ATCC 14091 / BCRC 22168 / CBS 111 / JCM 3599 / NBRC 0793 / NRRL Y-1031 F-60-10) TaxID=1206466 RepID=K0KW76_WICCF|nr:uncharacterized protein BN7_5330 [Wickerhamomyces ciferrii]CCH45744.1 hypothetical protein BN7_5330 [Wickerhamomyces ciferrii]
MNSADLKSQYKQKIFRLLGSQDPIDSSPIQSNDEFWEIFWKEPDSAQDIYNLLTFNDLKLIRDSNKSNFLNWIRILCLKLIELSKIIQTKPNDLNIKQLLNCIRYLTKILPILFEKLEFTQDINNLFWNLNYNTIDINSPNTGNSDNATIGTQSTDTIDSNFTNSSTKVRINQPLFPKSPDSQTVHIGGGGNIQNKCLGENLIHILVDLLFTRGFTLIKNDVLGVGFKIWEVGIGSNGKYSNPTPELDSNRLEVLRLILTLSSQGLYIQPTKIVSTGSRFLTILVSTLGKLKILTLICSLLNLICRSCKSDPELNGLYYKESQFQNVKYQDLRRSFITISLNLLTIMIVYPIPTNDVQFLYKLRILNSNEKIHNLVRSYFGRLHKENELNFISNSIISFLNKPMEQSMENELNPFNLIKSISPNSSSSPSNSSSSANTLTSNLSNYSSYLPNLSNWNMELTILLWELIQSNKNFKNFIYSKKVHELIIILIFHLKHYKSGLYKSNLIRIICYFLTYLTSDPQVQTRLITPINQNYYYNQIPNFFKISNLNNNQIGNLTWRDFLIIQICSILSQDCSSQQFDFIITPNFFNYLYNLIPIKQDPISTTSTSITHLKNNKNFLSYQASLSLINLISKISENKSFLINPIKLDLFAILIRSLINSCLRFPQESRSLIYNIVKHEDIFRKLLSKIETYDLNDDDTTTTTTTTTTNDDEDEAQDDSQSGTDNEEQDEDEEFEESLKPKPPIGMSSKAKSKLPIDAPLSKTWTGFKALKTLIKFIDFIKEEVQNISTSTSLEIMEILIKIENIPDLELKLLKISSSEFNKKTPFETLKFNWSSISLGWYESILWGDVFNLNSYQYQKNLNNHGNSNWFLNKGKNSGLSGLSSLKEVANNWGFNWNNKNQSNTNEFVKNWEFDQSILQINIWNGSGIKLFKIEKPLLEKPLVDVNNLMKKLRLNSSASINTINTLESRGESRAESLNSNQLTPINSRTSFNTPRNSIHINSRQNSFSNIHESPFRN